MGEHIFPKFSTVHIETGADGKINSFLLDASYAPGDLPQAPHVERLVVGFERLHQVTEYENGTQSKRDMFAVGFWENAASPKVSVDEVMAHCHPYLHEDALEWMGAMAHYVEHADAFILNGKSHE